ncbi:hypothetical protein pipiens_011666 [Culex pipiens pipiens]|uniref:Uncharacterized protein n=1 Tax=Culex pipiens pipiens TaxID=38569 RepID=A0ABD1D5D8_CULPP
MAIFALDQFPDVCRMCVLPKPVGEMIPLESITLEVLKLGNDGPIVRLFGAERDALVRLIRERTLCSKEEVLLQDFLEQFGTQESASFR